MPDPLETMVLECRRDEMGQVAKSLVSSLELLLRRATETPLAIEQPEWAQLYRTLALCAGHVQRHLEPRPPPVAPDLPGPLGAAPGAAAVPVPPPFPAPPGPEGVYPVPGAVAPALISPLYTPALAPPLSVPGLDLSYLLMSPPVLPPHPPGLPPVTQALANVTNHPVPPAPVVGPLKDPPRQAPPKAALVTETVIQSAAVERRERAGNAERAVCAKLWAEHCTRQLLHHVAEGDEEACLGDIRNGANVNAVGPEKQTALMAAQQKQMEKVCGLDTRRRPHPPVPPPPCPTNTSVIFWDLMN